MFGLMYVLFFSVYLLLLVWATRRGWRWGVEKKGWTGKKRYLGATIGFLIVYLPVFWDWLPTVAVHQYYCAKDAGFWVYKTLDQWKAENPGGMEGLVSYNKNPGGYNVNWPSDHKQSSDGHQKESINHLNVRFDELVSWGDVSSIFPIIRKQNLLLDKKNNEVIASYIDFGTGNSVANSNRQQLKFWMHSGSCFGGKAKQTQFGNFYIQFTGAEK